MSTLTSRASRSTRSRSRSRAVHDAEEASAATIKATPSENSSSEPVEVVESKEASSEPAVAPAAAVAATQVVDSSSKRTNHFTKHYTGGTYYWCEGEPDLSKVAHHLDKMTASDLEVRAAASTMRENIASLNSSVASLLDMNARLKRDLRAQKLQSNRRWVWAVLLLLAYTYGQSVVRSALDVVFWAATSPAEFFPFALDAVQVGTSWLFLAAFPLGLLLFVHKVLAAYGVGRLSLVRTISYLLLGIVMQVPLLYFLLQVGLVALAEIRSTPLFSCEPCNHVLTIGVALFVALVDYILVVLHQHV